MVLANAVHGGWSRRAVLGAAGSLGVSAALSGCSWFDSDPAPPPPPDPLEPMLVETRALAARYQRVIDAHPQLADQLNPLYEAHAAHEQALLELIGRPELASPSAGTGTWASPLEPDPVPADPAEAVAGLRDAELDGQAAAAEACLAAPPERAARLGSIAAARATHAEVL